MPFADPRWNRRLLCGALWAASHIFHLTLPVQAATDAVWSTEELSRLKAGEALVRVTVAASPADGDVRGVIDIPAPAALVWSVLYDCAGAPSFMESLKRCAVLEQGPEGAWDVREHVVQWTSFLPEMRSVFRSEYRLNRSIRFQRTQGDLAHLEGAWQLQPLSGGTATRLTYEVRVGFSVLVPGMLVRSALEKDVPEFLGVLRREVMRRSASR